MTSSELLLVGLLVVGVLAFRAAKRAKHPHRLIEVETALNTHADLAEHRNRDPASANELRRLAEHLKYAQFLANAPAKTVRQEMGPIHSSLAYLTSEDALKRIDLFYTDRREDIKAAIYALMARLQKKSEQAG